jgi:hypothetical protein
VDRETVARDAVYRDTVDRDTVASVDTEGFTPPPPPHVKTMFSHAV